MSELPFPSPDGRSFGRAGSAVDIIETHISWVFLVDAVAYKVKRPVDFGFVDYSTIERRRYYCERELALNVAQNPYLYREVVPVSIIDGRTCFGGEPGRVVDYAVRMRRFNAGDLLLNRAREARLDGSAVDATAKCVAGLHEDAARAGRETGLGAADRIAQWSDDNLDRIEALLQPGPGRDAFDRIVGKVRDWPRRLVERFESRRAEHVRDCHGDLHLGNLLWQNDRVMPFDRIEFNDELRWIDIVSDAAFTAMDLQRWCGSAACWRFLNRYLEATGDYEGAALFPFYIAYRALVRAKVALLSTAGEGRRSSADADCYLRLAQAWVGAVRPRLRITVGLSGSGKTTRAEATAFACGAVVVHSDLERRRLHGRGAAGDTGSGMGQGIYAPDATDRVYRRLLGIAECLLSAGVSVVLDATFLERCWRDRARETAERCEADFGFLHCDAPVDELRRRLEARPAGMSEATVAVLERQLTIQQPLDDAELRLVEYEGGAVSGSSDAC